MAEMDNEKLMKKIDDWMRKTFILNVIIAIIIFLIFVCVIIALFTNWSFCCINLTELSWKAVAIIGILAMLLAFILWIILKIVEIINY